MAANEYVSAIPKQGLGDVCPEPPSFYKDEDLMMVYKDGIASDTLVPDASTGRIPVGQLKAHVEALENMNIIKKRPTMTVGTGLETDMDKLVAQDLELYATVNSEYCFYEQRYKYALRLFLERATSRNGNDNTAAQAMLQNTKTLNIRVNSILEVMNYLAQSRVTVTNKNKGEIDRYNKQINDRLTKAQNVYSLLKQDRAIIKTQREMVRYTEEKNNYTTGQIGTWAALNVLALATIFYVYRS